MKTWFITGGTPGGFGMAYADVALEHGDNVVLTARRPHLLDDWAGAHGGRALVLPLDVTKPNRFARLSVPTRDALAVSTSWPTTPAGAGTAPRRHG